MDIYLYTPMQLCGVMHKGQGHLLWKRETGQMQNTTLITKVTFLSKCSWYSNEIFWNLLQCVLFWFKNYLPTETWLLFDLYSNYFSWIIYCVSCRQSLDSIQRGGGALIAISDTFMGVKCRSDLNFFLRMCVDWNPDE